MNEHNTYTFLALGMGIPGLLIFMTVIYILLNKLKKGLQQNLELSKYLAIGGIGCIISFFINGWADANFHESYQVNSTFISFAIAWAAANLAGKQTQVHPSSKEINANIKN